MDCITTISDRAPNTNKPPDPPCLLPTQWDFETQHSTRAVSEPALPGNYWKPPIFIPSRDISKHAQRACSLSEGSYEVVPGLLTHGQLLAQQDGRLKSRCRGPL